MKTSPLMHNTNVGLILTKLNRGRRTDRDTVLESSRSKLKISGSRRSLYASPEVGDAAFLNYLRTTVKIQIKIVFKLSFSYLSFS